jgi:DNA-binding transcriptional ArsR family regulator
VDLKAGGLKREDNSFTEATSYERVNRLNHQLETGGSLEQVCDRWIYSACLCFGLTRAEQRAAGFEYRYSIFQLELSRNYLFAKPVVLDDVYQQLLDRTRTRLDVERLKTIFGSRQRPRIKVAKERQQQRGRRAAETSREVRRLEHDLTVMKVHWDKRTLKLYDKGERLLRVEMVVHNAKALKQKRGLPNLGVVAETMRQTLNRFMGIVQVAHVACVDVGVYRSLSEPKHLGKQRMAGIQITNARMRSVMDGVLALSSCPEGFTLEQLGQQVRERMGWNRGKYDRRQAAYDLKKLRAKGLIAKRKKSRRYNANPESVGLLCGMATVHDRVLVPVLTIMSRGQKRGTLQSDPHPLDHHYEQIRIAAQEILRQYGVAA